MLGALIFIFKNVQDENIYGSYLPYEIEVEEYKKSTKVGEKSRLSWCYGDLGAFYVIYRACVLINHEDYKTRALDILIKSTNRNSAAENQVEDAGFCHGTSGIAHIYNNLWKLTGNKLFMEAAHNWLMQTLNYGKIHTGEKYKFLIFQPGKGKELVSCDNLLLGTSGVLLTYLSFLDDKLTPWDECVMLN